MKYGFSEYRSQMQREMNSADNLWVHANRLRTVGKHAEADRLEAEAERIDNRHANSNYSTWLNRQ